jgi:uncharacterized protein (DUF1800 family)
MDLEVLHDIEVEGVLPPEPDSVSSNLPLPPVVIVPVLALAVSACGEGGATSAATSAAAPPSPAAPPPAPPTSTQASRFLAQATMGANGPDIQSVVTQGYDGWLGTQFSKARATTFWNWLVAHGYNDRANVFNENGFDPMVWSQLISGEDQLRQRVGTALMSMVVVSTEGIFPAWPQLAMAAYMDILWDNAFGNYRTILDKISTSPVMAAYLTFLKNNKANAAGALPDENYAREIMQLFSIGLYQLNLDGTLKQSAGKPIETYTLADVTGLARVFTGWTWDNYDGYDPYIHQRPMVQDASQHELGAKTFLGTTIPAGTDGVASLKLALDAIFAHANVAPFVSKQLIQHLVTSNPSPAYVQRVAMIFENNGSGVRGDLRAVVRAILLDTEARNDAAAAASTTFGKLREPVMRFTNWARAFGATSPSDAWAIGDTHYTSTLGQEVGRSPSVFNWFRPGYKPPNTAIATQGMVAPELQIANEVTVINYLNFMMTMMQNGAGDFKANFAEYVAKAADSQGLIDLINLRLAANQVSAATVAQIKTAVDSIASDTPANLQTRVNIATILILASPEYLILK